MAASAARSLSRCCGTCLVAIAVVFAAFAAASQELYRYRDASGYWVYSDHKPILPEARAALPGEPASSDPGVWLRQAETEVGDPVLVAVNRFHSWAQIAFHVEGSRNLDPGVAQAGNALLPPSSQTQLLPLEPIAPGTSAEVDIAYQFILGHPGADHRPEQPYRLPYALNEAHLISQAFPDGITHAAAADRYAIDFEMPIGTPVYASRGGIVVDATGGFSGAGLDRESDTGRANFVRILHPDGTLALYGHLSQDSILVEPGQQVARGEHIADSGNTGFSSGPHLHFVVQRNRAGAVESVPVSFIGADGMALTAKTGDRPVAY